jgi:hypothetical protein
MEFLLWVHVVQGQHFTYCGTSGEPVYLSVVTRLRAGRPEFDSWQGNCFFIFLTAVYRPALGPLPPPIKWIAGIQRPEHEAHHSPPSNAEVKNARSCTSTLPCVFMAWRLIKHKVRLDGVVLSYASGGEIDLILESTC